MLTTMGVKTGVAFTGAVNSEMNFGLSGSEYIIKDIDGLGPVKAEITSYDSSYDPGGVAISARDGQRNIIIRLGFNPRRGTGNTISKLRDDLYSVLMPSSNVELSFTDDVKGVHIIQGVVESHEPVIFAEEPEVVVSVLCPNPYFKLDRPDIVYNVPTLTPFHETFVVPYAGNVPTGFLFEVDVAYSTATFVQFTNRRGEALGMDPKWRVEMAFSAGDHLMVSSIRNDRYVRYRRGSNGPFDAFRWFSGTLIDMRLYPGENHLALHSINPGAVPNGKITYPQISGGL